MEDRKSTQWLYDEFKSRIELKLEDNEVACPECNGSRISYRESGGVGYTGVCTKCYNGKVYKCEYCGELNKTSSCKCDEFKKQAYIERQAKYAEEYRLAFEKAEKIDYKDYNGKFLINNYYVEEDIADWIYEKIQDDEDVPNYVWATKAEKVFSIDLDDIISDRSADGYDEMYYHLGTDSDKLAQAQKLIDEWEEDQGSNMMCYWEDKSRAVIITDLVARLRRQYEGDE